MPPRKTKAVAKSDNAEQDDHASKNGDVPEGRTLRVRKRVDYNENSQSGVKDNDINPLEKATKKGKPKRQGTKQEGEKPSTAGSTLQDIEECSSEGQETLNSGKKNPRETFVLNEGQSKVSPNETSVVSGKNATGKGKRNVGANVKLDEDEEPEKKKAKDVSEKQNETHTDYSKISFKSKETNANGEKWNLKVSTWNVCGLRAWLKKDGAKFLDFEKPDIICLQEIKCSEEKIPSEANFKGYHSYWASAEKEGYSGVALLTKQEPVSIKYGMGVEEHDTEGRLITAEYEKFYLVATYVPNAGRALVSLPKRLSWNATFLKYLKELDTKKPVILCGDMNVSHQEIDLANPKTNTKNAGFTKEERAGMTELLAEGFIDTFRHIYPKETGAYTFWTHFRAARSRNIGWRLDYFIVSERIIDQVCDSVIRNQVLGSDHCPITLLFHNK